MELKKKVVIAGGGSGGHIYPGIAIAKALLKENPHIEIVFVGTKQGLEKKIVPAEGFKLYFISSGKLNTGGSIFGRIKSLFLVFKGLLDSFLLLMQLRPSYVLGVGGYASGPFVLMSALLGFRSAVWEPNAMPGLANRWLSRFVKECFLVFEEAQKYLKSDRYLVTGMPIREEIENAQKTAKQNEKLHLLLFGGSQGARVLNYTLAECVLQKPEIFANVEIVHQTGPLDFQDIKKKYEGSKVPIEQHEFLYDMPQRYNWSDLVICRSGASTLAELAAFGLVPITIPLTLADDHQLKNAQTLLNANAAVLIPQKELTVERLAAEIQQLIEKPERRQMMSENIKKFHRPLAAKKIAQEIVKQVDERESDHAI